MGEFGEKLRSQREQRGITLESVSNTTKISTRMLKALEDERFDQLPGGVFNKGFVRAYARQIGLDPDEAVTGYLDALRESQAQAHAIMPEFRPGRAEAAEPSKTIAASGIALSTPDFRKAAPTEVPNLPVVRQEVRDAVPEAQAQSATAERLPKERPRRKLIEERPAMPNLQPGARIPWGMVAAGLLVLALLLAFLSYRPRRQNAASEPVKPPAQSQIAAAAPAADKSSERSNASSLAVIPAAATPPSAFPSAPSTSSPASSLSSSASAGKSPQASSTPPVSNQLSATPPSQPAQAPKAPSSAPALSAQKEAVLKDTARAPAVGTTPTARTKPAATFTLLIRAEETSWVSITADGKPVAHETLIAPAGTSVRATQEIVVRAGNAAGLVFVLNGKTLPKQGEPGEVKTLVFDSQGMRVEKADEASPVAH